MFNCSTNGKKYKHILSALLRGITNFNLCLKKLSHGLIADKKKTDFTYFT